MAEANIKDIYIENKAGSGSDKVFTWNITLEETAGIPLEDISSASATFNVKTSYESASAVVTASVGNGITINDGTGVLSLILTKDHMANVSTSIEEQDFVYDLDLTDDNGNVHRLYKGIATIGGDA